MAQFTKLQKKLWISAWLSFILVACAPDPTPQPITVTVALTPVVRPYATLTPSPTSEPVIDLTPIPITPAPTATPFTHKVVKDETMLGIALKYGIKLEELMAANPTVNPRMMSVDTVLIVPLPVENAEPTASITPLPLYLGTPICYPSYDQGLTCLVDMQNTLDQAVENISAWVGLFDGGQLLASQVINPGLNRLPAGEHISLLANFSGPLSADARPRAELLTALPVAEPDSRYIQAEIELQQIFISLDGLQAQVTGQVSWQSDQSVPGTIWVVIVAYDAAGTPVGVRKLETRPACAQYAPGTPCASADIEMVVYSLGPVIHTVTALVEARP